jgi:plasmid maintenance system antidote protein VapI
VPSLSREQNGEYLKDELDAPVITQTLFAKHIGVSGAYLSDIVNGRRGISALMAAGESVP